MLRGCSSESCIVLLRLLLCRLLRPTVRHVPVDAQGTGRCFVLLDADTKVGTRKTTLCNSSAVSHPLVPKATFLVRRLP
jgi:hypothetical protein